MLMNKVDFIATIEVQNANPNGDHLREICQGLIQMVMA